MAKTIRVIPRTDGADFQESWKVQVSGADKSNHTTKQAAKNTARGYASDGDTLIIHRTNGTVQTRVTVRDASSGDSEDSQFGIPLGGGGFGTDTKNTAVDQFFK